MRLIDADKLLKDMKRVCKGNCKRCEDYTILSSDLHCGLVDRQPTIQPQGIDKDRLIEELEAIKFDDVAFSDMREGWNLGVKKAIRIVKKQPTTDGWIPVSDKSKLEDGKEYLITDYAGDIDRARYCKEQDRWFTASPIAYMPLPQPYKESE